MSYEGDDSQVEVTSLSAVTGGSGSGCGARETSIIDAPGVGAYGAQDLMKAVRKRRIS